MGELLEVQPVSWRVVSLNAPYLKSLCVFESLSRALGCCYNHHHPQVVSCECWVRLPAARMTRVRGHTTHTMATGHTPTINTHIEMGTYLVFHLADWSKIQQCHLVLHGIEKVPKSHNMTQILLQRVDSNNNDTQQDTQPQPPNHTDTQPPQPNHTDTQTPQPNHNHTQPQPPPQQFSQYHKGETVTELIVNLTEAEEVITLLDDDDDDDGDDDGCESDDLHKVIVRRVSVDITTLLTPQPSQHMLVLLLRPYNNKHITTHTPHRISALPHTPQSPHNATPTPQSPHIPQSPRTPTSSHTSTSPQLLKSLHIPSSPQIKSSHTPHTHPSLQIKSPHTPPSPQIKSPHTPPSSLTKSPHTPPSSLTKSPHTSPSHTPSVSHAWQFQSACIKVSVSSCPSVMKEGCGTLKKTLTRTKPLYFSKNGNVHRL
ncbi:hypothetical protein Pmani_011659 [Petrolisthes manimaculis]|uniref:Uncharacterized protein n=1 Tax=Petrolisthes manimaculis TaxID=1843537 RepID=A0AAE1PZ70_9EUCA|nr:hypothetical protein Pmani_011659 [Petrolisthes manimaculis]